MPVSFDQTCLYLTFEIYLSSDSYSRKHENVQTKIHVTILQEKDFSEKLCPEIWLCLFIFRPITLQLSLSLTSIVDSVAEG